jgi:hypothetical protein
MKLNVTRGVKGMATVKESLTAGVPAFDLMQPCALGPGGNPLATECPRCKNPHHACDRNALGVTPCEPCPRGNDKPEPTCTNRHQCWEPCGELGKSEEHVRVGRQSPDGVKGGHHQVFPQQTPTKEK